MKRKGRKILKYSNKTLGAKKHHVDHDGVLVRKLFRGTSIRLCDKYLKKKKWLTPNQITVFGFLITIPAFFLFLTGNYFHTVIAGTLAILSYYLDYVDGSLARVRKKGNIYGQWLDMYFGRIGVIVLFTGITWGVYLQRQSYLIWVWGLMAVTSAILIGSMYNSLHRLLRTADKVVKKEKEKMSVLPNFFWVEVFYYPLIFVAALFNQLYPMLIFSAIYGWIFALGTFYILGKHIKKEANKQLSRKR